MDTILGLVKGNGLGHLSDHRSVQACDNILLDHVPRTSRKKIIWKCRKVLTVVSRVQVNAESKSRFLKCPSTAVFDQSKMATKMVTKNTKIAISYFLQQLQRWFWYQRIYFHGQRIQFYWVSIDWRVQGFENTKWLLKWLSKYKRFDKLFSRTDRKMISVLNGMFSRSMILIHRSQNYYAI